MASKKSFKTEFKEPINNKSKIHHETKEDRMNKLKQIRQNKITTNLLKKKGIIDKDGESTIQSINATNLTALIDCTEYQKAPKLCVLVALNEEADLKKVALSIYSTLTNSSVRRGETLFTGMVPLDICKGKERLTIVCSDRTTISALDYCKVADIIVFVSSCKSKHNLKLIKKDPYEAVNVIDEVGYNIISSIKTQGLLPHVAVIQDIDEIEEKYHHPILKLYSRYIESVLTPNKIINIKNEEDDIKSLVRTISGINSYEESINLRKHRSYMLCDTYYAEESKNKDKNNLVVKGYIKGNTLNNFNYIHLTGFGDFLVQEIFEDEPDPCPIYIHKNKNESKIEKDSDMKNTKNFVDSEQPEVMNKNNLNPTIIDDEFKKNKLEKIEKEKLDNMINDLDEIIDFKIEANEEDISFHDEEEQDLIKAQEKIHQGLSKKHEAKTSLFYRSPDEMEVADEVDTPTNITCRELFEKYRGLSSMKTGSIDPTLNLPKEYSNIYSFENLRFTYKEAVKNAHENGLRISGKYVKIVIKDFNLFHLISNDKPLVLSSLLNHERKLCVMHVKIQLNEDCNEDIYSKELVESQIGFRRNLIRPIYSYQIHDTDKYKKIRKLEKGKFFIATFYAQLTYQDIPVIFMRPNLKNNDMNHFAIGKTMQSDCNKILIKKIVLTGYPLKIHKKKVVVRYMFFNPEDVNYFKPVSLHTKLGLRGNIVESLGTHGYMKCTFNDTMKPNDTICMALYKRVFPVWFTESWRLPLGYSNDKKYYELFENDTKEFQKKELERYQIKDNILNKEDDHEIKENNQMLIEC